MDVKLTEKAVTEVKQIMAEQQMEGGNYFLRVGVRGGGCSGFSWCLSIDEDFNAEKDILIVQDGIKIISDNRSALYMDGTVVDYFTDGLLKRGFVFSNPSVKSTCGCGSSFSM